MEDFKVVQKFETCPEAKDAAAILFQLQLCLRSLMFQQDYMVKMVRCMLYSLNSGMHVWHSLFS